MATKGTMVATKQVSNINKKRGLWATLSIVAVVLLLGLGVWWFFGGGAALSEQRRMEAYLEEKYGQEFVVEKIKANGSGLGSPGLRVGVASPVSDKSLKFNVGTDLKTRKFFDGYSGAIWAREEKLRIDSFLAELYKPATTPQIDLVINIPTGNTPDPIKGKVPSLASATSQYAQELHYSLTIDHPPVVLDESEKVRQGEKLKAITDYIKNNRFNHYSVLLRLEDSSKNLTYACNITESSDVNKIVDMCFSKSQWRGHSNDN